MIKVAWLAAYERRWLRADMVAGLTLAAYLLPAGLADASLAGLPSEAGLYACLFGGLVFWLFCSSRQTAITVTSAISLLIGVSIGELAGGDPTRYAVLAAATAILVALLAFAAWAAKAGVVVNFVSETVLVGFKCGVAFVLASTQLPKLLGFKGGSGDFWSRAAHIIRHLNETHMVSLLLGLAALAVLLAGKRLLPNRPIALLVVVAGVAATSVFNLDALGVHTLGAVPQGLPPFSLPLPGREAIVDLLPIAMACFLLASVETAAIGRMFALKHGYRFDPNREFLAIGSANLMSGLGQGFPISGGLSQSLVNESAGARTPLSGLIAALIIGTITLFFSGALSDLPQPVLAAIVLAAVTGLVHVSAIRRLYRFGRAEFASAALAFLGVLGAGLLQGVLIGAALSVLLLLRRGARPNAVELGRVGETTRFGSLRGAADRTRVPGVFVFRVDGGLLYFNAEFVRDQFAEQLAAREDTVHTAIFFLGSTPAVDLAGADLLIDLRHHLAARGIDLRLAGARGEVQYDLIRAGLEAAAVEGYADIGAALANSQNSAFNQQAKEQS
jgi:SulP family sulfate permease